MARGIIAYSDQDAARILGRKSAEIEELLGFRGRDEMIHRDDLVLMRPDPAAAARRGAGRAERALRPMNASALSELMDGLGRAAAAAAQVLALAPAAQKDAALAAAAAAVRAQGGAILAANERDLAAARAAELSAPKLERLRLDARARRGHRGRHRGDRARCPTRSVPRWPSGQRPNGLRIQRVRVPLGVIGIIYESRPNVTADAGALCLKSGNAVILRGGSESRHSSAAHPRVPGGRTDARRGCRPTCIQLVPTTDRAAVGYMLAGDERVPRRASCRAAARAWSSACSRKRACR